MPDPHRITSLAALERTVGAPEASVSAKLVDTLGPSERRFIGASPMILMATADRTGAPCVSPKGDAPGFVSVLDDRTLLIPDRPGNRLAMGLRNLLENPQIALIFLVPGTGETLRVEGKVVITCAPELLERMAARGRPAVLVLRVDVTRCFFHCAKAFLRSKLWQPDEWRPEEFSWGEWAKERFALDQETADALDQRIEDDERQNL